MTIMLLNNYYFEPNGHNKPTPGVRCNVAEQ